MKATVTLNLKRNAVREAAQGFHTTNPQVFGSVLYGGPTKRTVILICWWMHCPAPRHFDLGGLQLELEKILYHESFFVPLG